MNRVTIITNEKNWMEDQAVTQLKRTAELPGILSAVGLPDLHPGKTPIGAVFFTHDQIYPHLIGNDIGCGMSFFKTAIEIRKFNVQRSVKKMQAFNSLKDFDTKDIADIKEGNPLGNSLGTIGGGNHFAELQEVFEVKDKEAFDNLRLEKGKISVLIHSGSRGYGQKILERYADDTDFYKGFMDNSEKAKMYLEDHSSAMKWASINRKMVALKMASTLGLGALKDCIEVPHNFLESMERDGQKIWVHRKGAAPSNKGPVVIPGSRGALTYVVMPTEATSVSGYSLAHGAGRKWERGMCKGRLESKYTKETLRQTRYKSQVICSDTAVLYEEAPEAYKNIEHIIAAMEDWGLIKVVATLKPILTYKG